MTNDTNITNDKDINANIAHDDHFNDSIVNEVILEDMKKNRIDHMKYLPDMEVLDSDIMDRVVAEMDAYDYDQYTAADVRAALSHEYRTLEDFKALLSPAAQPFIEEIAQAAPVSYTHLTLPTKRIVEISGVAETLKKKQKQKDKAGE